MYAALDFLNGLSMPQHLQPLSTQPLMVQRTVVTAVENQQR